MDETEASTEPSKSYPFTFSRLLRVRRVFRVMINREFPLIMKHPLDLARGGHMCISFSCFLARSSAMKLRVLGEKTENLPRVFIHQW